jgi:protein phosphatase 1L
LDESGSCMLLLVFLAEKVYISNLGDSRAIISERGEISLLSLEHNITLKREKVRIARFGGSIKLDHGILKVSPGDIVKTRSVGDIKLKSNHFIDKVEGLVISNPDFVCIEQNKNFDFIIIGSSGLYEKLTNTRIATIIYETSLNFEFSFDKLLENIIANIIKEAIDNGTKTNISCVIICFENFYVNYVNKRRSYFESLIEKLRNTHENEVLLYSKLLWKKFF